MARRLPRTRRELHDDGITDIDLRRLLRRGDLVRVSYDRYSPPAALPVSPEVIAAAGGGVALSHGAAARAWALPCDDLRVHVTIRASTRRRAVPAGTVVHRSRRWEATILEGVPVTTLPRTLADVAGTSALADAVVTLDAGLRHASLAGVRCEVARRGVLRQRALRALDLADPRAESPLESRLRLLLVLAGLPPDGAQHVVRDRGRFVARVDLWFDGLVVEADGFAFHSARDDYRRDRRRQQAFARLGLRHLPFSWEDVHHDPDLVVADVRQALAALAA
ncbi:MAG: DUF559 domain-containing protein [Mycobacteriales bacterium]